MPGPPMFAAARLISSFAFAVDDLVAADERREVRLVGDVEEDRADADGETDDVELPDRQPAEPVRDRHRHERDRAPDVAEDEDRLAAEPVDPDARRGA